MTVTATVKGGDRLARKLLSLIGPAAQERIRTVNDKSAKEFIQLVRVAVPQSTNPKGTHLADTIQSKPVEPLGVAVSIGASGNPYPAHLEWGHHLPNGVTVPGKPFWFPAVRVLKKRRWGQIKRAQKAAISAAVAAGN